MSKPVSEMNTQEKLERIHKAQKELGELEIWFRDEVMINHLIHISHHIDPPVRGKKWPRAPGSSGS